MSSTMDRRNFLKNMAIGAGALSASAIIQHNETVGAISTNQGVPAQDMTPEEMDAHHEMGVKMFLDYVGKDPIFWNNKLEYTMDGDVKVFELTCTDVQWVTEVDNPRPAFAYNGTVPGPEIRVTEGDKVRVIVNNQMQQSTVVHWHGVDVPNDQDGVPYVTQPPIKSGESFTYEFVAANAGSHMYHSHHNSTEQVVGGLLGPFIIEPKNKKDEPIVNSEYTLTLNDTFLGFTLNGRSFPYTQPIIAKLGDRIRIRFYNEGLMIHPMHLHGMPMQVFAKDGYNLPAPYWCDTLNIAPGERYDAVIVARALGVWAFHCHILSHVEDRNGMFGMVTAVVITE